MISSIIQYEGSNDTFVWKHPLEDFNTGTQLIVHESQEAIFFMNGQALDSFGPGRYTLDTQNIPMLSRIFNAVTGGDNPFHCEVYFVNKTEAMAIKWGTDSKMEFVEPTYGFPIQIGACGEMSLRIENARKLQLKIVGTEPEFLQTQMFHSFRAFLLTKLKPYITTLIRENNINIFQIDEYLVSMSDAMRDALREDFTEYGVALEKFLILNIAKPEDDKNYRRFKELHFRQYADIAEAKLRQQIGVIDQQTAAQRMVIEAEGIARKRQLEGYSYQDERRFDVAEQVASNQATGELANLGIGMGMISGIGGTMGNAVGDMMTGVMTPQTTTPAGRTCPQCSTPLQATAKFCLECGAAVTAAVPQQVICPKCGASVYKSKFCSECGASQVRTCPSCSKEVADNAKFCLECGAKLV